MSRRACAWLLVVLAGCMEGSKPTPLPRAGSTHAPPAGLRKEGPAADSLYNRLGGRTRLEQIADAFVATAADDDRLRPALRRHFEGDDAEGLKRALVERAGAATGGPERPGKDVKVALRGVGITNADFDALVADLVKALDKNKVPAKEQDEVKAILGPLRADVVERQD
jgi:hemoglobin